MNSPAAMVQSGTCLLGRTCVVGGTKTGVVVDPVDAGGSVLAVVVLAVVHIAFAGGSLKTCGTRATAKTRVRKLASV